MKRLAALIFEVMQKAASRLIAHFRHNAVMWISLAAFVAFAWLTTGTSCVVRSITGLPCPGCGLTRAILAALQGNLAEAFRLHPLFWLAPLILLAMLLLLIVQPEQLSSRRANRIWLVLAAVYILVYIIRMFIYFPDTEPLTYNKYSVFGRIAGLLASLFHQ